MYALVVVALLVLPAALNAQITIPVSIGRVPVRATIGASGITLGSNGVYARIPYPEAGTGTTASRTGGTTARTPTRTTAGGGARTASRASASRIAANVLNTADDYQGVKYTWGGETARGGFDCSGFTQFVFREHDVFIPRTSREQARVGDAISVSVSAMIPGDLMFFDASGNDGVIDHVAIFVGDNLMIHSSSSGNGVGYDNLSTERGRFFVSRLVAVRRVIGSNRTYAYAGQQQTQPSLFGWLAKSLKGGSGKPSVTFDAPDWAPRVKAAARRVR